MDVSEAKDRMLEVENLTDALEDDDANWLLDWGTKQVGPLIQGIADDDQAGEKVNQLMGVMRSVNRITGDRSAAPPDELADDIHQLVDKYNAAFGTSVSPSNEQITALVGHIGTLSEHDAMQALLDFVAQPSVPQAVQPAPSSASNAPAADATKPTEASASTKNTKSAPGEVAAPSASSQQAAPQTDRPEVAKQNGQQSGTSGQEESHA